MTDPDNERNKILHDIAIERTNQLKKWGPQTHLNGCDAVRYSYQMADWRSYNDLYQQTDPELTWKSILLEEIYKSLVEDHNDKLLEHELIQSAAVIVAWIEDLRSKRKANG